MTRRFGFLLALAGMALLLQGAAQAQPTDVSVEAAFLPRFARYVTWPASAMPKGGDPFVLCVIGSDPYGGQLEQAAGSQLVDGRRIVVRRLSSAAGADECQIAFIAANRIDQLADLAAKPVLTVTDSASGHRGIIHFVFVGGRVRFFIDQASAERRRLNISSRLLALALGVRQ